MKSCYYFGCHRNAGHYLWDENERIVSDRHVAFPFRYGILDAGLLPNEDQVEGKATITHFQGWTVVSFWDRSVDKRGGCNSAFVVAGNFSFEEVIEIAKVKFHWVWMRFTFKVFLGIPS